MKQLTVFLILSALLLAFACSDDDSGNNNASAAAYSISFTFDGKSYSFEKGYSDSTEATNIPFFRATIADLGLSAPSRVSPGASPGFQLRGLLATGKTTDLYGSSISFNSTTSRIVTGGSYSGTFSCAFVVGTNYFLLSENSTADSPAQRYIEISHSYLTITDLGAEYGVVAGTFTATNLSISVISNTNTSDQLFTKLSGTTHSITDGKFRVFRTKNRIASNIY